LGSPIPGDSQTGPTRSVDLLSTAVRNPRSDDLRNDSWSMSGGSDKGSVDLGSGSLESGPTEASSGFSASASEGGSIDLSKTNELLQQLVDAVRKQQSSSLPIGGPLVYADR
jgi:hypothetical protein